MKDAESHYTSLKLVSIKKARFPSVVGTIDGTHVMVKAQSGDLEPYYVNKKGYHSTNVQAIFDANGKFLDGVVD